MAKFLLGVLSGILLCVFFVVLLVAVAASFSSRPAAVADGSTLVLDLRGEIVERNPTTVSSVLLQPSPRPTLKEIRDILKKAAVDRRVTAIVLKPGGVALVSVPYLKLFGTVAGGWMMARAALVAGEKLKQPDADRDFLQTKLATARFYAEHELPRALPLAREVTRGADSVLALDPAKF